MLNLFQSELDPNVFGFTEDPTGTNLPARFAPWRKSSGAASLYLGVGESSAQLGAGDPVLRAVETQGFCLVGAPSRNLMDRWRRQWRHPE